jgi:hypothetical protein
MKFVERSPSTRFENRVAGQRPPTHGTRRHSSNHAAGPVARTVERLSASLRAADTAPVAVVKRSVTNRARSANRIRPRGPLV